jgi:hypothetical protein
MNGTLEIVGFVLVGIGALACAVFFFDYLRTAQFRLPYARLILVLNGAIAGVLSITLLRRVGVISLGSTSWTILQLLLFVVIDSALIYQIVLLYRARRDSE